PKSGIPVLLRFEKANGLLRQSGISLWSSRLIRHYSDWREIDGVLIPFAEKDESPEDESLELIKIDAAKVNPQNVDGKIFERPPNIHDYAVNGDKISATVPYEDDGVGRIFVRHSGRNFVAVDRIIVDVRSTATKFLPLCRTRMMVWVEFLSRCSSMAMDLIHSRSIPEAI